MLGSLNGRETVASPGVHGRTHARFPRTSPSELCPFVFTTLTAVPMSFSQFPPHPSGGDLLDVGRSGANLGLGAFPVGRLSISQYHPNADATMG